MAYNVCLATCFSNVGQGQGAAFHAMDGHWSFNMLCDKPLRVTVMGMHAD
jgi:hypothetical protein